MTIWNGITEQGAVVPIQVDAQGRVVVSGGGGTPVEIYGTGKAWASVQGSGVPLGAFNLSCSRAEAGKYTFTFDTPRSDNNYIVLLSARDIGSRFMYSYQRSSTGFTVETLSSSGTKSDIAFDVAVFDFAPISITPFVLPTSTVNEVKALKAEVEKLKTSKNP